MAHHKQNPVLRTYPDSSGISKFTVLGFCPNCSHVQESLNQSIMENI